MGRTANRNNPVWLDQRDLMQNLHHLEEKIFERSKKFFFDTRNGCYVLDDELLPSKATDLESKTLCSRKTGKEGSTADIICDSFLQVVLGMRLRTSSDTQLENVEKLLDTFPPIEENRLSDFGPLLACDRGYGKKKVIQLFAKKHYKVITVCAAAGSEHPIVPTSVVNAYHKKLLSQQSEENMVLQQDDDSEMIDSLSNISQWTIADNEDVLLGPEIKVAMDAEVEQLYAIAYRDIFDKKIAQKILRFFIYGFPNSTAIINRWSVVGKVVKSASCPLFVDDVPEDKLEDAELVEQHLLKRCTVLTTVQRSCDWFTLRAFHLTATMAGKLFTSTSTVTPTELIDKLMDSWFSRSRSTTPMVIGSKNENAVLKALSNLDFVSNVFDVGLIEHINIPWLAASPDAISIIQVSEDSAYIAPVEVKTRVAPDKILEAEMIAQKYNHKIISCGVGDEVWKECVEPEHSTQVMMQMIVLRVSHVLYIVARAGSKEAYGRILYVVLGKWKEEDAREFVGRLKHTADQVLLPFYESTTVDELLHRLPSELNGKQIDIIATRWPFFKSVRDVALGWQKDEGRAPGFPKTELFKHLFNVCITVSREDWMQTRSNLCPLCRRLILNLSKSMSYE
jgi:hypothetical protein